MKLFRETDDGSIHIPATVDVCRHDLQEAQADQAKKAEQADSAEARLARFGWGDLS